MNMAHRSASIATNTARQSTKTITKTYQQSARPSTNTPHAKQALPKRDDRPHFQRRDRPSASRLATPDNEKANAKALLVNTEPDLVADATRLRVADATRRRVKNQRNPRTKHMRACRNVPKDRDCL